MVAVIGAISAAVVVLEQGRSRGLVADEVKLWQEEDGTIRGVQFVTGEVTEQHWALINDATDSLQSVNLSKTQNVAGGLAPLAEFPRLRNLQLADCRWVDDAQVSRIAKRHRLHALDISGTSITDRGLQQFDLTELRSLTARRCPGLTGETLELLSGLRSLTSVSLPDTPIPFEQYEQLRIARPELLIAASPVLTWTQVDRPDLLVRQVNWLTDQTDVDQFVRYWSLRHDWQQVGETQPSTRVQRLTLGGPGVSRALPEIFAELEDLESLTIVDTQLDGGLEHLPPNVASLTLNRLHVGSQLGDLASITWLQSLDVRYAEFTPEQWQKFFAMIAANRSLRALLLTGVEIPAGAF